MTDGTLPLAVTCGEPAGIGPDITLLAWAERKKRNIPAFYVRGNVAVLSARAERLGLKVPITSSTQDEACRVFSKALPVVETGDRFDDHPGVERPETAASVIESIRRCTEDVNNGLASALVTNPINKSALYGAGFSHPGHTEYLGALAKELWPTEPALPVMLIAGPDLMVIPITIHIPLNSVHSTLTQELIVETAKIADRDLRQRFGLSEPRLAFCGLNPHAGEGGTMGREELETIIPALETLRSAGINAIGPLPADTMFHPSARAQYDCALGMYHDQVLVPAKTIGFDDSVNVTLGLPFVRTSPDHGTAYTLAGTGEAKADSLSAALRMASVLSSTNAL
ncbi:MAG: 4-hydroxythreonine-4-phosphate dehydrogenase PdxA [Rhodobacteraceae bacterium]|nr:4-hydroxythreonine-4-phosphate dehydrogenase PdxA [Paracoccaceae bacterium]